MELRAKMVNLVHQELWVNLEPVVLQVYLVSKD